MPTDVSDATFEDVLKADKAIVDFWAEWCGPCRILGPRFKNLSEQMTNIKFFKLNVDDNQHSAQKYQVRSIPTLILFNKGKEIDRIVGALPEDSLKDRITKAFA